MAVFYFLKQKREISVIYCVAQAGKGSWKERAMGRAVLGRMTVLGPAADPFSAVCFALQSQRRIQNMTACSESKAIAPRLYKHRELNV